jgi:hypothetical protein
MHASKTKLTNKIEWACDLHAAAMEVSAQDAGKQSTSRRFARRAIEVLTASVLYVATLVMWIAIALKYV